MPAKELGTKYVCFKCATRFYDLGKPEPLCPKCGADQRESPAIKPPPPEKRSRAAKSPPPVLAEVEADPVPEDDDEEGEEVEEGEEKEQAEEADEE